MALNMPKMISGIYFALLLLMLFHIDLLEGFVGFSNWKLSHTTSWSQPKAGSDIADIATSLRATLTSRPPSLDVNPPQVKNNATKLSKHLFLFLK